MSKTKDHGSAEKPSTPAKKPTQDKPVMSTALTWSLASLSVPYDNDTDVSLMNG